MKLTYVINAMVAGDGVGNAIVDLVRLLLGMGHDLQLIHAGTVEPPDDLWRDRFALVRYEELVAGKALSDQAQRAIDHWRDSALVLYDYSIHYRLLEVLRLPHAGKTLVVYHSITPPALWPHALGRAELERGIAELGHLAPLADVCVAASDYSRGELIRAGVDPDRAVVVPYSVRADRFRARPKDAEIVARHGLAGHFVLLYVGRMASNKRVPLLVEGLAAARSASGLPIKLVLVGDDADARYRPEVEAARERAAALEVADHVVFTGRVSDADLPRYYATADLYLSASLHEGFGIPLVEAMAAGRPVVAARAASVPGVLGEAGTLFEPDDAAGLGDGVARLLGSVAHAPTPDGQPPRLCIVTPRYGEGFSGGAEMHARIWAEACHADGWPVEVVTTTTTDMIAWTDDLPAGDDALNGVPVHRFRTDPAAIREFGPLHHQIDLNWRRLSAEQLERWATAGIAARPLYDWLRDNARRFDSILFIPSLPYVFNRQALADEAVRRRSVVIPCLHDEGPAWTPALRDLLDRVGAILFNTEAELRLARDRIGVANASAFVLGIGIDTDAPTGDPDRFRAAHGIDGPFIVYVGRMEHGKNVPLLVECFNAYKAAHPGPLQLVLLGGGDPPTGDDVRHLGFVDEATKQDALAAALALVNPSVKESFSLVLMESWIQRRPVIVHGDCPVTVDHVRASGGGAWFADADTLGAALTLLQQPGLADRMGAAGRAYVERRYALPAVLATMREQLDLTRQQTDYERRALAGIARAREFGPRRHAERWGVLLERLASSPSGPGL